MTYAVLEQELQSLPEIYWGKVLAYIKSLKSQSAKDNVQDAKETVQDKIEISPELHKFMGIAKDAHIDWKDAKDEYLNEKYGR